MEKRTLAQIWLLIKWKIRLIWVRYRVLKAIKNIRKRHMVSYPLSGRALSHYAKEHVGIRRRVGEKDEELRRRCADIMRNTYEGTAVVPVNRYQEFFDKVAQNLAVAFQVPVEVLTGEWIQENDPKQEGDA